MSTTIITRTALAASGLALAVAGCGTATHITAKTSTGQPAAAATQAPAPAAAPSPGGTGSGSCNYTLSASVSGTDWLTAEVDLTNTGNVAAVVRVTVAWPQEGFSPITSTRTVRLPYGATGKPVRFHVSAGSTESGSNVIENLQSWESGHNYPSNDCTYNETFLRTFGPTH
jgi:hypothetical protein